MAANSGYAGSNSLHIGIALVLQDQFSNQARTASAAIQQLETRAKQAINSNLQAAQQISLAGLAVGSAITGGMRNMINFGADYSKEMVLVKTISGATANEVTRMDQIAQDLAVKTMFNANEVASGMRFLAMAGNDAQQTMNMIGTAATVANALGMELGGKGGTADLITNIMRTFKMEGEAAAVTVGDVLTKAVTSSNTSLEDMAAAIKYAGADVVMVNQSLESMAAAIGVIGDAGIQGSMAGTALANMMRNLILSVTGAKAKGTKALAALGMSREDFIDAKGNVKDLSTILATIRAHTKGLTSDKRLQYMFQIFGLRGNRAGQALLSNIERYEEVLGKIRNDSKGFAHNVSEEMMGSLAGGINQLKSMWENFKVSFAQSIAPVIMPILRGLTKIAQVLGKIVKTPIGKFTIIFVGIYGVLLKIASTVALLRIRFLLLTNDSTVNFNNMFNVILGGWRKSTAEMTAYYATMDRLSKIKGVNAAQAASMAAAGYGFYGGITQGVSSRGKAYTYYSIPKKQAPTVKGMGQIVGAREQGGQWFWVDDKGGIKRTSANSVTSQLSSVNRFGGPQRASTWGKVGRGLGKAGGIAGLALTLWSLGSIIASAFTSNKDSVDVNSASTDSNTSAINSNTKALGDHNKYPDPREELIMIYNALAGISDKMGDLKPIINVDVDNQGNVTTNTTSSDPGYDHNVR